MEWLNPVHDGSRNSARLARLLTVINESRALLSPSQKGSTYLLGPEVKYVDFLFYSALRTMAYCYGVDRIRRCLTVSGAGNLYSVFDAVKSREKVQMHLKSAVPVLYESVSAQELFDSKFSGRASLTRSTPAPALRKKSSVMDPSEMSSKNLTGYVNKRQVRGAGRGRKWRRTISSSVVDELATDACLVRGFLSPRPSALNSIFFSPFPISVPLFVLVHLALSCPGCIFQSSLFSCPFPIKRQHRYPRPVVLTCPPPQATER